MIFSRPICFVVPLLLSASLSAQEVAVASLPYAAIVSRNMFGLVPIPTASPADPTPVDPPPKITPNGIMQVFGKVQVLFKVAPKPKPGQPVVEESYVMCEGERQDEIEVTKIDEKAGVVTFVNHGTVQELTLEAAKNGSGGGTPGGGLAASPGAPLGIPLPRPSGGMGGMRPGGNVMQGGAMPSLNRAAPGQGNPGMPSFGRAGGGINNVQPQAQEPPLSPEAQVILIEAQRQMGGPGAEILPPTPMMGQ